MAHTGARFMKSASRLEISILYDSASIAVQDIQLCWASCVDVPGHHTSYMQYNMHVVMSQSSSQFCVHLYTIWLEARINYMGCSKPQ